MQKDGRDILQKLYFSISEVAKIADVPPYVLRFWEGKFSQLHPQKSRGGHRRYQRKDIELVLKIKELLHQKGFTMQGAQRELTKKENTFNPENLKEELKEVLRILQEN